MPRIFISTGEVSGDLQGALLIQALQTEAVAQKMPLEIVATGGPRMAAAGADLIADTTKIGSIGLVAALNYVLPTLGIQRQVQKYLQQHPPDTVVLIDYMSVNVPLGGVLRRNSAVPIAYYIAPQEWVWTASLSATGQIARTTSQLLAIFPEEAKHYQKHGANVTWVGHPLVDRLATAPSRAEARQMLGIAPDQLVITLVPASRRQEITYLLPVVLQAAQTILAQFPQAQFWLPLASPDFQAPIAAAAQAAGLSLNFVSEPLPALAAADLVITKSGTVNLEAALLNVPQIVIYRVHPFDVWFYRTFLKFSVDFISPVNLVTREPIVTELLQDQANPETIAKIALEILQQPQKRDQILQGYAKMRQALGEPGAVQRAAQAILQLLPAKA